MKTAIALIVSASMLSTSAAAQSVTSTTCREQQCRAKLVTTIDKLNACQERLLAPVQPVQMQATIEYRTPKWVWWLLGASLVASTAIGIYGAVKISQASDLAARQFR